MQAIFGSEVKNISTIFILLLALSTIGFFISIFTKRAGEVGARERV